MSITYEEANVVSAEATLKANRDQAANLRERIEAESDTMVQDALSQALSKLDGEVPQLERVVARCQAQLKRERNRAQEEKKAQMTYAAYADKLVRLLEDKLQGTGVTSVKSSGGSVSIIHGEYRISIQIDGYGNKVDFPYQLDYKSRKYKKTDSIVNAVAVAVSELDDKVENARAEAKRKKSLLQVVQTVDPNAKEDSDWINTSGKPGRGRSVNFVKIVEDPNEKYSGTLAKVTGQTKEGRLSTTVYASLTPDQLKRVLAIVRETKE